MSLTYQEYFDKVLGGWIGKCLGGAAGAPVEGIKDIVPYNHYSEVIRTDLPNDDLDLQLLWLEVLQKKGVYITAEDLADAWDRQCWYPFNEYGIFLKNYERGILPPYSGEFNNPLFKEGNGCPIRSEIWGMAFPGDPAKAAGFARMDGSLDHAGAAICIEEYFAAMDSAAFFENDITTLIKGQLHYLPEKSRPRNCVEEILKGFEAGCEGWRTARQHMMRKYAHFDFTNAVTNLGIVIIALLYGQGDMDLTVNIAFRCGYDTDCTCATAAALLGITIGAARIEEALKKMVGNSFAVGIAIEKKPDSIAELAADTCAAGIMADTLQILDIPKAVQIPEPEKKEPQINLQVEYKKIPSIGWLDRCDCRIKVSNLTDKVSDGLVIISGIPSEWEISGNHKHLTLSPGQIQYADFSVHTTGQVRRIENKNLLHVDYAGEETDFGIAGASVWQAVGPYFEPLVKQDRPGYPSPHGEGCSLPTLECMVNNSASLQRAYINEENFRDVFSQEDTVAINAYEDLLPLDEIFSFQGQGTLYLRQTLISPEERDVWAVIGNNDAFCLWVNGEPVLEKDEIRLWTPYNNYDIIHLLKGKNEIVLKLLKRTESWKFSFGLRKYEGGHFHRKRWYVDFCSEITVNSVHSNTQKPHRAHQGYNCGNL